MRKVLLTLTLLGMNGTLQETTTTANGNYGYWLTQDSTVTSWGSSSTNPACWWHYSGCS